MIDFQMRFICILATHLSNQCYSICFRRNLNKCGICFFPTIDPLAGVTPTIQVSQILIRKLTSSKSYIMNGLQKLVQFKCKVFNTVLQKPIPNMNFNCLVNCDINNQVSCSTEISKNTHFTIILSAQKTYWSLIKSQLKTCFFPHSTGKLWTIVSDLFIVGENILIT